MHISHILHIMHSRENASPTTMCTRPRWSRPNRKARPNWAMSTHIWGLKARGSTFNVKWKVLDRGAPFTPVTGRCSLCTKEKFYIFRKPEIASLNSRQEVGNHIVVTSPCLYFQMLGKWKYQDRPVVWMMILSFCVRSSFVSWWLRSGSWNFE